MIKVLPVINCSHYEETEQRIRKISKFLPQGEWIHLDIADGRFTFHKTSIDEASISHLKNFYNIDVHLMVLEPEKVINHWIEQGAKRIAVHYEAIFHRKLRYHEINPASVLSAIKNLCEENRVELAIAINPETKPEEVASVADGIQSFQILSVHPGLSGQNFLTTALPKIAFLRERFPNAKIEVDGGMIPEIVKRVKEAGADAITSESYLFSHRDPGRAFEELRSV